MKIIKGFLTFVTAAAIPFFLMMAVIQLLFTPLSTQIEYNLPGFPADPYGFTTADRIHWANISIQYIVKDEDISFLSGQKLQGGQPLYNERELSHMVDVQNLYQLMVRIWIGVALLMIFFGIIAWRTHWLSTFWRAVSIGGWITLGLIGLILVGIFIGFSGFFTGFHRIFFTGDTWLFYYSDSLIRLFPLKLWQDGFTAAGVLTGILAFLTAYFPGRWSRN